MTEKRVNRSPSELSRQKDYHRREQVKRYNAASADDTNSRLQKDAKTKARELKNRKNRESKTRSAIVQLDGGLLGGNVKVPSDLEGYIKALIENEKFGDNDGDHCSEIYSASLKAITDLPIGLLSEKECMLPRALLPSGFAAILRHCRRMISVAEDEQYIACAVAGWETGPVERSEWRKPDNPAHDGALEHLKMHAQKLAQLESDHPSLYEAVLCGRHKTALSLLRQGLSRSILKPHDVRAIIAEHGLIYCLHDLQLIAARARRAETNPFESLVSSTMLQMKPEKIANQARHLASALTDVLNQYTTEEEEGGGKRLSEDIPRPDLLRPLASQLRYALTTNGVSPLTVRSQLDDLVRLMRAKPVSENRTWLDILNQPISRNKAATSFNALWFSNLSITRAISVTILRYLQAEKTIGLLMDERDPGVMCSLREHTAMPTFDWECNKAQFLRDAQDFLFLLRRGVLQDKDFAAKEETVRSRSRRDAKEPIKKAAATLEGWGQREMGADSGAHDDDRRTFYLLDVIPEHRLSH